MNTLVNQSVNELLQEIKIGKNYINGKWQDIKETSGKQDLVNPATEELIITAPLAGKRDVDDAVTAAKSAENLWKCASVEMRASFLNKIADALDKRRQTLVELSILNNGKIRAEAEVDVDDAIACYRYYAELISTIAEKELIKTLDNGEKLYLERVPVGVSSLIVPWNFPMVTTAWKVAPALAAGCTVVLKPSEITLLPELVLGDIATEIGLPEGVLNIISGGAEVGDAMVKDQRVRKVSFTGSNKIGELVMQNAATNMHKLSLELGGKSPIVVFDDVDLDWAVDQVMAGIFFNTGEMCSATSRLIIADSIADEFYLKLKTATEKLKLGDGSDKDSEMGPVVSDRQYKNIQTYFEIANQEKLTLLTGGKALDRKGYFISPTVYIDVPTDSRLWQEEIFGPVLVTQRFKTEEEAVELANLTDFGLAGTVLSKDRKRGWRVINQLNAGALWLNGYQFAPPFAGWGGFKQSGLGRELGREGLSAFQETKYIIDYE